MIFKEVRPVKTASKIFSFEDNIQAQMKFRIVIDIEKSIAFQVKISR
jgi:hypothetical protein